MSTREERVKALEEIRRACLMLARAIEKLIEQEKQPIR